VYINLIAKIVGVDDKGNSLNPSKLKREHILTAKEFSDNFQTDLTYSYRVIKEAVDKLMKTDIKIVKSNTKDYRRINVCSQADYCAKQGKIIIRFTEEIMPYLAQVTEKFTLYKLKEISEFKSIYSLRLYELLQDFKDTGYLIIKLESLRTSFGVGIKFKKYNDFKRKTFDHAVKEINKHYHIDLDFQEIKEGRKVDAIKFTFNKTKIARRYRQDGTYTNEYIKPKEKSKYQDIFLEGQLSFEEKTQNQEQAGNAAFKAIQNLKIN
jgi:plasmid replication initiation protein